MRIRDTDERLDRLRRLQEATGENTKAGAIDLAMKHYLADLENKRRLVDALDAEHVAELSTAFLPLEKEVTTDVGLTDEKGL